MKKLSELMQQHGIKPIESIAWADLQGDNRPQCGVPGCDNPAVIIRTDKKTGHKHWRRAAWIQEQHPEATDIWCCSSCHSANIAKKHGVPTAAHVTAKRHGLTITEYQHRNHPYLKHRKDYCENRDGRLGFECTYTAPTPVQLESTGLDKGFKGWLQVDHKDGNHTNNSPENLQTLCACCHYIKTYQNGDYSTPGRKTRKPVDTVCV